MSRISTAKYLPSGPRSYADNEGAGISFNGNRPGSSPSWWGEANVIPFPGGRTEDASYRSITKKNLGRELPAYVQDNMISLSFLAYRTNPMANRLVEMELSFILGNGISVLCSDPSTLLLIQEWWNDPYNAWKRKIAQRYRDYAIYGEWLHHPLVATDSGMTWIRDIQPDNIQVLNPDQYNHSEIDSVVFKEIGGIEGFSDEKQRTFPLIRYRLDEMNKRLVGPSGTFFHFGDYRTSDSLRGVGSLFPVLDYIDLYDNMIYSRAAKIENMSKIWWDLQLDGLDEKGIKNFLKQETNLPPQDGTVWAHNGAAILKASTADLKADDHATDVAVMKSFVVSSRGWPGTWFDEPGSAGRAVGAEMAEPAIKNIQMLQSSRAEMLCTEIDFYLAQVARIKGSAYKVPKTDGGARAYTLSFSRPSARDFQKVGPALMRLAQFIKTVGSDYPLADRAELRQILVSTVNQLNLSDMPLSMDLPADLAGLPSPTDLANQAKAVQDAQIAQGQDPKVAPKAGNPKAPINNRESAAKLALRAQESAGTSADQLTADLWKRLF